ncbi:MAG TPA: pyridoxamine 5'-phosphate oxidase family protein [Candidatus Saccharimonadales bacterium]|nr:pyridoxamine 5'-phosphate oxidase family protein [Candidatus Saccharimonadales bacterium]
MSPADKAKLVIDSSDHMTIATVDSRGEPWVTPIFYVNDATYDLFWVSYKESAHSKNIDTNPKVAIVIYGPVPPEDKVDAVYIEAAAKKLEDESEVLPAIEIIAGKIQEDKYMIRSPADVTGNAAWRIYKATPQAVSKRTENGEMINGQFVTTREDVSLLG